MGRFVEEVNFESVLSWFEQFGQTDKAYLEAHFDRFLTTKVFAFHAQQLPGPQIILDVGSHWLHNAFVYANDGHKLVCVDVPNTLTLPSVQRAGEAMGAMLKPSEHLELGDGIQEIEADSVDLVLFCEIIEHITFNPIPMWKAIYRVLKPGGQIIITTPNANYWQTLLELGGRILHGKGYGPTVENIFRSGTFGHHWKEFTPNELQEYFTTLSPDWAVKEIKLTSIPDMPAPPPHIVSFFSLGEQLCHNQTMLKIALKEKSRGIRIDPPWIPKFRAAALHVEAGAGQDLAASTSAIVERDKARAELDAALKALSAIKNSSSWKITSPFRKLTSWYRKRVRLDAKSVGNDHNGQIPH